MPDPMADYRALTRRGSAMAWKDLIDTLADHGGLRNLTDGEAADLLHEVLTRWEGREVAGPPRD